MCCSVYMQLKEEIALSHSQLVFWFTQYHNLQNAFRLVAWLIAKIFSNAFQCFFPDVSGIDFPYLREP